MDGFLNWFFEFMTTMLGAVWQILSNFVLGLVGIFNFPAYFKQFGSYGRTFNIVDWILSILMFLIVFAIWGVVIVMIVLLVRKYIRFRKTIVGNEDLLQELSDMHRDVVRLNKEKEKLMALQIGQTSVSMAELKSILAEGDKELDEQMMAPSEQAQRLSAEGISGVAAAKTSSGTASSGTATSSSRFFRLAAVDKKYEYYVEPTYRRDLSLQGLCEAFRNFACTQMHLYYDEKTIRLIFAGLASTKLVLLQGISGTGKTSLPYAMGKFFKNDATIASVQPSWRDRTELFGYFNEFTKKFNETEVLRRIYEASYNDDINIIILDEMNIARVEYYFAEMLSILEMPDPNEWRIELVPSAWDNDPKHLSEGKLAISQNIWYVGTANNDDSTYAISDKVYDRALVVNLDKKGIPFDAPETEASNISYHYVANLYAQAQQSHPVSQESLDEISKLDLYVIEKFRVAFGNRIMKQLKLFVPVYVECGGTEVEGIDYILATKVFRKFESLNLSLIRDEIPGLVNYLDVTFGPGAMVESIAYLERLKKMY